MSDTKKFPATSLLLASGIGSVAVIGSLAGFAWLMVKQGMTQEAAAPFATAAVCFGSCLSGMLLTALQKEKALLCGAAEGVFFAGLLFLLGTLNQSEWEAGRFIRAGLVLLMGVLGGILGMMLTERRRH